MGCDVYFWRQSLILFSDYLHCFGAGLMLTFPAILNPAILSEDSDIKTTPDQVSWIAASQGIAGVAGFIIMPTLMQRFGRKATHYAINISVASGFIIFFFATNVTHLFIARSIQGLGLGGVYITSIIIAEYSAPIRRGYFTSIKKSATAFASLLCHTFIEFCSWRQFALIGAISNIIAIILTIAWPESPAYLAMKGRLEECDKSYTWLNGNSVESRKELDNLILAQTDIRKQKQHELLLIRLWKKIFRNDFQKPFIITTMMTLVIECCGIYYNLAYIVQIMTEIVKDKSIAVYCSIAGDIMTLIALCVSCFAITNFKRRTILLTFGFGSVALMLLTSLAIFLINKSYIGGILVWLPPCLIFINSFVTNLGIMPICFTVSGEIFPLEHRGFGTCSMGIVFTIVYSVVLKCTPIMMNKTGIEGTYAIFGLFQLFFLIILYYILNETKDKTLQEIEDEIKGVIRNRELSLINEDVQTNVR